MIISFLANIIKGGGSGYSITTKAVTLDDKTELLEAPENVAWDKVSINAAHVYDSGYTSGYTDASAFIPVITGESYTYSEDDDLVKTISAQTGTAFSAVTVDATNKFTAGYKLAAGDVDSYSEELTVSANGIYNADIQYDVRGYFKKVTVDVPGSGPSYGVVADMTGVGFELSSFTQNNVIEFEFICPDLSAYTDQNLYIATWDNDEDYIYCKYNTGFTVPETILTSNMATGFTSIKNIVNTAVKLQLYRDSIYHMASQVNVPGDTYNYNGSASTAGYNTIYMFKTSSSSGELPRYFKSLKLYSNDIRLGGTLIKHIVPRSDGKMWDLVSNQEADIVWEKFDGTYPTTFTMLSEYNI